METLTSASKPICETESSISPVLIKIVVYGSKPTSVVTEKTQKGTPTTAELAFRNQFGTIGVSLRNRK